MDTTPLMKQFAELKAQVPDALLLFRMGDFYELFGDDAVEAAKILEITLTSRDKNKPNPLPMAGVPHHSAQGYIQKLLRAGRKIAIGEQVEDPATVKGKAIVRREIVRVLSPAIQFDHEGSEAAYLATTARTQAGWIIVCLDPSTGEARVGSPSNPEHTIQELGSLPIRHFLRTTQTPVEFVDSVSKPGVLLEEIALNALHAESAQKLLSEQYGMASIEGFVSSPEARHALALLIHFVLKAQKQDKLLHLRLPQPLRESQAMQLGPRTPQHLDLISEHGEPDLFREINSTRSALGARELRRWLLAPLKNSSEIRARQNAVSALAGNRRARESLSASLGQVYDLERIAGRINAGLASPRDTLALGRSLATLPQIGAVLGELSSSWISERASSLTESHAQLSDLSQSILRDQCDDAPLTTRDGGIFNKGLSPDLDRLIELSQNGEQWLLELETRERAATGIPSLKVRYNRVFGYYIEITQAHLALAPAHYQRKQTTVGAERFFTEELKKFEEEILTAEVKRKSLEQSLFKDLCSRIRERLPAIMSAATELGRIDSIVSLAALSDRPGWCMPEIIAPSSTGRDIPGSPESAETLEIRGGRHPLVAGPLQGKFVPNDLSLSEDRRCLIITGPNMGGKSTVMRQVALIVILGQMGAPVPAASARWTEFHSVYTRIGAHDAISRGQSTFMVEMSELAQILHSANPRSLLILDEIGRGTSTYDGMSVAWAALDWIARRLGSRALFATHYHELTHLSASLPGVANAHLGADTSGKGLRFTYLLKDGATAESFGIHVAELAGVPKGVVQTAWKMLERLESSSVSAQSGAASSDQLSLFAALARPNSPSSSLQEDEPAPGPEPTADPAALQLREEIENLDLNQMTPVQALNFLVKARESLSVACVEPERVG